MAWIKRLVRSPYLPVTVILALAAVLRVWNIDQRDLWLDEAFSALYAELPLETLIELRRRGTNPPLYHVVLGWWARAFGDDEWGLRMMSAVAGMAAVGLAYPLGSRLGGRRAGIIACALVAVNNWAVCYSREARYYALTEALAMLTTLLLYDALRARRARNLIGYTVAAAAAVWVHTFAWFVWWAQAVWVVLRVRALRSGNRRSRWAWCLVLAGGAVVLSFVPWLPILADQMRTVSAGYWVPSPRWADVGDCARGMIAPRPSARPYVLAACALAVAGALVGRRVLRRRPAPAQPPVDRHDIYYLCLWLVIPIAVPLVWSLWGTPIFQPKYAIVSQPAALVLLAVFAARRPVVCGVLYAAVVLVLKPPEATLVHEDWRAAARLIDTQAARAARVFVYRDYCYFPLRYYLDTERRITPVFHHDGPPSEFADLYPGGGAPFERMREAARGDDEVWIVLAHVRRVTDERRYERLVGALLRDRPFGVRHRLKQVEVLHLGSVITTQDELRQGGE